MSIREKFVDAFGEADAVAMEAAAETHKNGIHDDPGSDSFRWAVCICIGYECFTNNKFREEHGFKASPEALKEWIQDYADLESHDGDVDFLALMAGAYSEYLARHDAIDAVQNSALTMLDEGGE